ncbi:homoprotocatechuate degradation operon regulator HpaR [Rheinheimera salexigens]|uniref:Homoprotocatechuate degradation operon regulator, HpaR n=1 Tax=Rheinheimera salexigens TaxID=1628148 RepID=A0A1E7Q3M4_9GAMM|nr:homoprotocatechuate degradation operon regulator HpaR [Rheinheimera salexigens]OEY68648.1 homoprotocatechuate degradation operon regulator, HpaR [Rheinheimera salexigens]
MLKFNESLPMKLVAAREVTMSFFRPILHEVDFTDQQWRVLRALSEFSGLEFKELAKLTCILSPSLTGIIKRLEERNLIYREKSQQDQRCTLLFLTPEATQIVDEVSVQIEKRYAQFKKKFGAKKLERLLKLLDEVETLPFF